MRRKLGRLSLETAAVARLEFVQFVDGCTWGDPESVQDELKTRRLTLYELRVLENTLREEGEHAFTRELLSAKQQLLPAIASWVGDYEKTGDPRFAEELVQDMIEAADHHALAGIEEVDDPTSVDSVAGKPVRMSRNDGHLSRRAQYVFGIAILLRVRFLNESHGNWFPPG